MITHKYYVYCNIKIKYLQKHKIPLHDKGKHKGFQETGVHIPTERLAFICTLHIT